MYRDTDFHECLKVERHSISCDECIIEQRGYCEVYRRNLKIMFSKLVAIGILEQDVEDIIGEVVEGIVSNINNFSGDRGAFSAWSWRIFVNKRTDFFRRKVKQSREEGEDRKDVGNKWGLVDEEGEAHDVTIRRCEVDDVGFENIKNDESAVNGVGIIEKRIQVRQVLKKMTQFGLTDEVRLCEQVYKCFKQGLSQKEAAQRLGMTEGALKQAFYRLRKAARELGLGE